MAEPLGITGSSRNCTEAYPPHDKELAVLPTIGYTSPWKETGRLITSIYEEEVLAYKVTKMSKSVAGNPFGAVRAESDAEMLRKAFVETSEYKALTQTNDFHFIVGRRGTGKSALFVKVYEYLSAQPRTMVIQENPAEYSMIAFQEILKSHGIVDYKKARTITRIVWKTYMYMLVLQRLKKSYKFGNMPDADFLTAYSETHKDLIKNLSCPEIFKIANRHKSSDDNLLEFFPRYFSLRDFEAAIRDSLAYLKQGCFLMFDGLDEGWQPNALATAIVGGLSIAVADLSDSRVGIHGMIFVRDNMFRALATLDEDYSRHIEGSSLRLHWDARSLFTLIVKRIRVSFQHEDIESDTRVWNRFAQRELADFEGFQKCLLNTLYRPRDVLVLLNLAFQLARKEERHSIIEDDIETAARRASHSRLEDLHKEYDKIFPGISEFTALFRERPAIDTFGSVASVLQAAKDKILYDSQEQRDFAILGTGTYILFALYSVGFIGILDRSNQSYTFCHDGTSTDLEAISNDEQTMIHPCYWRALDIQNLEQSESIINQINDEYERKAVQSEVIEAKDVRLKRIGTIIGELAQISMEDEGNVQFAQWVLRSIQILFPGKLSNAKFEPSIRIEDMASVVAQNIADKGFWKKSSDRFGVRTVLFDIKNSPEVEATDIAGISRRTIENTGKLSIIVTRSEVEIAAQTEIQTIKSFFTKTGKILMVIPSCALYKCIRKLRSPEHESYIEDYLKKRIIYIHRQILGERSWYW